MRAAHGRRIARYPLRVPAVVLRVPKPGYRNGDFLAAARRLGVEVIHASDVCHQLAEQWEDMPVALRSREAAAAADELVREVRGRSPAAVVGVDDSTALAAALAAVELGLRHNPPAAVAAARSESQRRELLRAGGLPLPRCEVVARCTAGT